MTAGSQVSDTTNPDGEKQKYATSQPFLITQSGHELSFYDTPDNQRLVVQHSSGSTLEFKADGSVFIKAVKDMHVHESVYSSTTNERMGSDKSGQRSDTDKVIDVTGKLTIRCAELDIEVGSASKMVAGTDFVISANNVIEKATEGISLEAAKSIYVDAKEYKERVQSHTVNMGSHEDTPGVPGGLGVMNVNGNFVLRNEDPTGGITIASAGYMNIVTGQERCDITGRYLPAPGAIETEQRATWTQKVYMPTPPSPLNLSQPGGDYWFESQSSAYKNYAMTQVSPLAAGAGLWERVVMGNHVHNVAVGARVRTVALNEHVIIGGIQTVRAAKIFLN